MKFDSKQHVGDMARALLRTFELGELLSHLKRDRLALQRPACRRKSHFK